MSTDNFHPTVTLAEAMTQMAFGKSFDGKVLLRFQRRHYRTRWPAAKEALDAVGQRLALLAHAGKLVLRGRLQETKDGPEGVRSNVPQEIFADVVHFEPLNDVIEMDVLVDDHWVYKGYPRYRNVRLDLSQIDTCYPAPSGPNVTPAAVTEPNVSTAAVMPKPAKPRVRGKRGYAAADEPLVDEIFKIMQDKPMADYAAAKLVVHRAHGVSDEESKIKRLVKRIQERRGGNAEQS